MAKQKSLYVCQQCGYQTLKWMGRCPECGSWNSLIQEFEKAPSAGTPSRPVSEVLPVDAISLAPEMRLSTDISEFDRTLGGGVVPGSLVLVGGAPGIGKSTLILQVLDSFSRRGLRSLYVSAEESPQQIKLRAQRLSVRADALYVVAETCMDSILAQMESFSPDIVAVDSIQTVYTDAVSSAPGSISQVRESASLLMGFAKRSGVAAFLIGHVTKEGAIAGPKILEHLVDTVLYFEGDRHHLFRVLRSVKNRYGSTDEIGVFEMKDNGLTEVGNPSRLFLQERPSNVPGSVVIPCLEGSRPVLVEIQALVGTSPLGVPRRTAIGVDSNRISLLVAVLSKRMGLELGDQDIFVNVAGGLKLEEPGTDLAVVSAMMSSFLNRPLDLELVVFGEVGLAGEIRGVSQPELRLREAQKQGFTRCLLAPSNLEGLPPTSGMELTAVGSMQELHDLLFAG